MPDRLFDPDKDGGSSKTIEQIIEEKRTKVDPISTEQFLKDYQTNLADKKPGRSMVGAGGTAEKPRTVYWVVVAKSPESDKFFIGPYFCLPAGTKIMLGEEKSCSCCCSCKKEKRIEDIIVGDKLMTYNESTNTVEIDEVAEVSSMMADEIVTVVFSDGVVIKATPNHPFYHLPKKWVNAGDLVSGDFIVSYEKVKLINSIDREKKLEKVYDISMKNNHNFFAEGVLVHNTKEGSENRVKNTSGGFVTVFKTIEQDPERVKIEYSEYEHQI